MLKKIDTFIDKVCGSLLVVVVLSMLFIGIATILCRLIHVTVLWFDPLIRHLVFLSAFLGGVLAVGKGQHIGIDILGKYLESHAHEKVQLLVLRLINLICAATLIWAIVGSLAFVKDSFQYEGIVFLGIHRGILTSIIPLGFGLMAIRFLYGVIDPDAHYDHDHEHDIEFEDVNNVNKDFNENKSLEK